MRAWLALVREAADLHGIPAGVDDRLELQSAAYLPIGRNIKTIDVPQG